MFDKLWEKYPTGEPTEVRRKIRGKVGDESNDAAFGNTCAIRMSYALNYAGMNISFTQDATSSGYLSDDERGKPEGKHKKWHYFRVTDMQSYVEKNYPQLKEKKEFDKVVIKKSEEILPSIKGKKGILFFDINFKDATGHIALWNGEKFARESDNYTNHALLQKATFYRLK